jgi:hypothetical protein
MPLDSYALSRSYADVEMTFIAGATEAGAHVTPEYKNARSNEYATGGDFCRIYLEQMNNLYLLALLLTADPQKAEQCFLSGLRTP